MGTKKPSSYEVTYSKLLKRYKNNHPNKSVDDNEMADWLIDEVRPRVSGSSWRSYRNSTCEFINDECAKEKLKSAPPLNTSKTKSLLSKTVRTRKKGLDDKELQTIENWVRTRSRSNYSMATLIWLKATLYTGLRPQEWLTAKLIDSPDIEGGQAIRCTNLKGVTDSNGYAQLKEDSKSHQVERTIDITHLTADQLEDINLQLQTIKIVLMGLEQDSKFYETFYNKIMVTMHQTARAALPPQDKYPTIYSGRHQFASNLKAAYKKRGLSRDEASKKIAVLMGQGSPKTSQYNYGLTYAGDDSIPVPEPCKEEFKIAMGRQEHKHN